MATLTGDNGLLQKATTAKQENEKAKELELIKLAVSAAQVAGEGKLNTTNLKNELEKNLNDNDIENNLKPISDYWNYKGYKIDKNGKVEEYNNILPPEYQQVEYIESSGTQWIDTMIVPSNVTNFKILIEMQGTNVGRNGCQRYNYKGTNYWCLAPNFGYFNDVAIQCGPAATEALVDSNSTTQKHIYGIDVQELKYIYDSNQIKNNNISNINAIDSFFIFASNYNESAQYFNSSKLYNCKIYNGDLIIKCFIPCYSTTTVTNAEGGLVPANTKGLYDIVEGKFHTNANTAEDAVDFIAGPEV